MESVFAESAEERADAKALSDAALDTINVYRPNTSEECIALADRLYDAAFKLRSYGKKLSGEGK
jgi:hypothetical protein